MGPSTSADFAEILEPIVCKAMALAIRSAYAVVS